MEGEKEQHCVNLKLLLIKDLIARAFDRFRGYPIGLEKLFINFHGNGFLRKENSKFLLFVDRHVLFVTSQILLFLKG